MMDDAETIRAFQWADDDTPLPVNPDDPDEVAAALEWATREYRRYDSEYMLALHRENWQSDDTDLLRHDRDALGRFNAALMRTLHGMRQRDRDALTAWTMGEPIHGGECTAKQAQEGPSAPLRRTDMLGAEA